METAAIVIAGLALCAQDLVALAFLVSSIYEREKRAAVFAAIQLFALLLLTVWFAAFYAHGGFSGGAGLVALYCVLALGLVVFLALYMPLGRIPVAKRGTAGLQVGEAGRWDERDTVFSLLRKRTSEQPQPFELKVDEGPARFNDPLAFKYGDWPREPGTAHDSVTDQQKNALDSAIAGRSSIPVKGRIDGNDSAAAVAMSRACAIACAHMAEPQMLMPEVAAARVDILPGEAALRVKGFARQLGAVLVGIAEVNPLWVYSNRGSSSLDADDWGSEITANYRYAIVFAEEMGQELVDTGPHTPTMVATMVNYAKGSFIAAQLATFIAGLGYRAKADQMEHYDALTVPLAVDAGLGELSRMGYLITKEYGPRVRLNVVLTDLKMQTDQPVDIGVADFCAICNKCAHCCPSNSIPDGEREVVNGYLKWKMDAGSCMNYWRQVGTDCSICMRVCPWSHARTFPHKLIVEFVSRNALSRRLFNWMDDLFYGKRPKAKQAPAWVANSKPGIGEG